SLHAREDDREPRVVLENRLRRVRPQAAWRLLSGLHEEAPPRRRVTDARRRPDPNVQYAAVMDLGLEGKVALVTGSYRGTGAGVARVLAAEGVTVLVHGLEPGQAGGTLDAIADSNGRAHAVVGDIRTEDGTAALAR